MGAQPEAHELAYLAGILDGEGSCIISRHVRVAKTDLRRSYRYGHRVALSNTDMRIIDACTDILNRLGVVYSLYEQDRRSDSNGRKHVTIHLIVSQFAGILKIAEATGPYLRGKKDRMEKLVEAFKVWRTANLEWKESLYQEFKILNARVPRIPKLDPEE